MGKSYRNPLSAVDEEIAHYRQSSNGVQLFTAIGGFGGSSTRTELAAGIIAICCNGPAHIGSDSRAFVDKANGIIQHIASGVDPQQGRPWNLCDDQQYL